MVVVRDLLCQFSTLGFDVLYEPSFDADKVLAIENNVPSKWIVH